MNNPINMIKMMMGKMSPKDMAMKMIENNSNPVFANLIDMANRLVSYSSRCIFLHISITLL